MTQNLLFYILPWVLVIHLPVVVMGQSIYATPYTVTTLVGQPRTSGTNDGTGNVALFNGPTAVTVDTNGNVYVMDSQNVTIREVTPAGAVTTLAGQARSSGSADGTNGAARFAIGGFGGPAGTVGMAIDNAGNLYVADTFNYTIRKVAPVGTNWVVTTLAGLAGSQGNADGTNHVARFSYPFGVAVDSAGNLYVADYGNDTIRKVTPMGTNWVVTTLAGLAGQSGSANGTNSVARFDLPTDVAVDSAGNLYVADARNYTIRRVTPVGTNWIVTTICGSVGNLGSADGTNSAARFNAPNGVAADTNGNLYVTDTFNGTVREVTPIGTNWVVTTLAGLAGTTGTNDGTGSIARFGEVGSSLGVPFGVAVDNEDNVYVADAGNDTIRKGIPASLVPAPILQPPSLNAGRFGFGITGLSGLAVDIEDSVDLASWQVVSTNVLTGGTNFYDNPTPTQSVQFYRAHVR